MKIIGLIGYKRVGKSTAASYLADRYGYQRHNMKDGLVAEIKQKFPDLLNLMVFDNGGDPRIEDVNDLFTYKPPLMRALMQNYGTEVRRAEDPDYWVSQWWNNAMITETDGIITISKPKGNLVCDDIRFTNEAEAIKDCNGILIRLIRPDITTGGTHSSETEQDTIEADYTIECIPGDHQKLYTALDEILLEK